MKTRQQRINETFQLLEIAKKQPLTEDEQDFLKRNKHHTGQSILPIFSPTAEDEKIISGLTGKLPNLKILIFESCSK
jgi:uncharacterized protein YifE (UPF0438 family)